MGEEGSLEQLSDQPKDEPKPKDKLVDETAERTVFVARVFLGVNISILIHVVISVVTWRLSLLIDPANSAAKNRPLLLEWIEPSDLDKNSFKSENQIVRKADLPKDLRDLSVKPVRRFLSEDLQTVKNETKARASGLTENRSENPLQKTSQAPRARERLPEIVPNSIFEEGLGDVLRTAEKSPRSSGRVSRNASQELLLPADPRRNKGISTTGERLPDDVQIGDFTALNTDRFVFYTYYARIEEQIRHRWVRYVKAAIFGGGRWPDGAKQLTTNLEIVLDRRGEFVRAIVHQGSGSRDVDAAPILAFREAQRIPNPPREMVKADGTIRLLYSFNVDQLPPLARAQSPVRGQGSADADAFGDSGETESRNE